MRISEAARQLGTSARMLRYREDLGLLPRARGRRGARGFGHRQFTPADLEAVAAALELERRYDISPASLAFGLRVLAEPPVRAAVADLGRRFGCIPAPAGRALDFEKERALRLLGGAAPQTSRPQPGAAPDRVVLPPGFRGFQHTLTAGGPAAPRSRDRLDGRVCPVGQEGR